MNIKDYVRLIDRICNLIFWMILAYLAGDIGMGFYYTAFIIFELLAVVFSDGIKHAMGRMVAVRRSKGLHYNSRLVFRYGLLYSALSGILIGSFMWAFAGTVYRLLTGYTLPSSVFSVLGVYFLIHAIIGCLQGYFQGKGDTLICIIAELVQCVAGIALCPFLVIRMYRYGMKVSDLLRNPLYANIGGVIGGIIAQGIAAIICMLILIIGDRLAGTVDRYEYNSVKGVDNRRNITISILKICGTYIIEHIMPVLMIAALILIYVKGAYKAGIELSEAFITVGVFAGKFLIPVGFFMAIFIEYSDRECKKIRIDYQREEHKNVRIRTGFLLKNSVLILIPLTLLLEIMAKPISTIFFDGRMSLGATMLRQGGTVLLFCGICYACKGALASVKCRNYGLIGSLAGLAVTIVIAVGMSGTGEPSSLTVAYLSGMLTEAAFLVFMAYRMIGFDIKELGMRLLRLCGAGVVFAGLIAILDNFIVMNPIFFLITLLIAYAAYAVTLTVIRSVTSRDINSLKGTLIYYPLSFLGRFFAER